MGGGVNADERGGVDVCVDLGGGERGVAEQFLDRTQIPAMGEQMRRKGVPQGVRSRSRWQSEPRTQELHRRLDLARRERPAADGAKQRGVPVERVRAERGVTGDRLRDGGQYGHHAGLAAFSRNAQGRRQRMVAAFQRQRFGDSQTAAIEQAQNSHVSCGDPGRGVGAGFLKQGESGRLADRARLAARRLGSFDQREGRVVQLPARAGISEKAPDRGQGPLQGARPGPLGASGGEEGAPVGRPESGKVAEARRPSQMTASTTASPPR